MLKLFKSSTALIPFIIILSLLIGLRISVVYNGYVENNWIGNLAPLSIAFKNQFGNLLSSNVYFNLIVSALLVFLQSTILVSLLGFFKVQDFKGFLAAWLYVLLMHMFPSFVFLSPELIALTFILLAFSSIVFTEESRNKTKTIFTSGLFIGLAAGFWLPSTFFIIVGLYAILRTSYYSLRDVLLLLIGFFVPFIYVFAYLYIVDIPLNALYGFQMNQFHFDFYQHGQLLSYYVLLLIILLSIQVVFKFLNKLLTKEKVFFQLIFFYILCFIILLFFQNENNIDLLLLLIFPTSIFLSVYFNRIKRNFVAESLHLILLLTIIVNFIYFLK